MSSTRLIPLWKDFKYLLNDIIHKSKVIHMQDINVLLASIYLNCYEHFRRAQIFWGSRKQAQQTIKQLSPQQEVDLSFPNEPRDLSQVHFSSGRATLWSIVRGTKPLGREIFLKQKGLGSRQNTCQAQFCSGWLCVNYQVHVSQRTLISLWDNTYCI